MERYTIGELVDAFHTMEIARSEGSNPEDYQDSRPMVDYEGEIRRAITLNDERDFKDFLLGRMTKEQVIELGNQLRVIDLLELTSRGKQRTSGN